MHPRTYTDSSDDSNECDRLLPHSGSQNIISAHNLHSAKRRKDNFAVFVIVLTSCLIEYAFYAINGNLVDFLKEDLRFSSYIAVCVSLTFIGSCSILTIFGGVLGEAVLNFYRVICCGLVLQLAGASFFVALGYTPHPKKDGRPLFFTCLGFQAACLTFTQAGAAILGAEQIKQRGSNAIHRFFQIMYWMNNIGSFIAILVTGTLFDVENSSDDEEKSLKILSFIEIGFTIVCIPVFVCGKLFYSIPKKNDKALFAVFFTRSVPLIRHLWHLCLVFSIIMIAQLLHTQIDSTYAAQGRHLNLTLVDTIKLPVKISSLANNIAVLLTLPLFWMFKHLSVIQRTRNWYIKPLDRMAIGLLISILGVLCAGILDYFRFQRIHSGSPAPSILWQIPQYFLQGIAELFTFVTAYYFAFTEAPNGLSGLVMGLFFGARGLGSYLAAFLTYILSGSLYPTRFNESHCGYFMFLLCGISGIFLIIYLLVSNRYMPAQHKDFGEFDVFYLKNSGSDYGASKETDVQGENSYKQISHEIEDFYSSVES